MSQILYINILVEWSLSGIMGWKRVIRESESPRPAASSILISRMTSSSVIIPYLISGVWSADWLIDWLIHNLTKWFDYISQIW